MEREVDVHLGGAVGLHALGPHTVRPHHRPYVLGQRLPFRVPGPVLALGHHGLALPGVRQEDRQALVAAPGAEPLGPGPAQGDPEHRGAEPPDPQDGQVEEPERGDMGHGGSRQRGSSGTGQERRADGPGSGDGSPKEG